MIDTGSEANLIGPGIVEELKLTRLMDREIEIYGCGGKIPASKWYQVPYELANGVHGALPFLLSSDMGTGILLGAPFLKFEKVEIDYGRLQLRTPGGPIPIVYMTSHLKDMNDVIEVHFMKGETATTEADEKVLEEILKSAPLNLEEKTQVRDILMEFGDLWSGNRRGETHILQHTIRLTCDRPVRHRPRQWSPEQQKIIVEEVEKMIANEVIVPSTSAYCQEPVLVKKKDGTVRFCIDFRALNKVSQGDEWPLPRIRDLVRSVRDSKLFIALDLRSGYWQIPMEPASAPLTAFRTRSGLYEFRVMPFGLKTAPATFCRLMDRIIGDLYWNGVCVYLDDVLIHGKEFPEVMVKFREVLTRLRDANLTLALNKCLFFPEQLLYLGFIIEGGKIKPNPKRIQALQHIKTPSNVSMVRSLLGYVGYFRQFIPAFSQKAEPLNRLLRKRVPFVWSPECEKAKEQLINDLCEVTLANPLEGDFFKLETDASDLAIGAALYCRTTEEDEWKPVEFISHSLNETQRRWPVHEREMFAIVHALEKFDCFLRGRTFDVFTDNSSLQWVQTTQSGKVARWASRLAEYNMTIKHRKGKTNVVADYLSRFVDNSADEFLPDRAFVCTMQLASMPSLEQIKTAQQREPPPNGLNIVRRDGIVFHMMKIWIPPSLRARIIETYHNQSPYHHPGIKRTLAAIRKVYSWPGLYSDAVRYIRSCLECQRLRPGIEHLQGMLAPHRIEGPFHTIYMDIYTFTVNSIQYNILSIIDFHTKWVESGIIPDKLTSTIASFLISNWICRYGCPRKLVTDNDPTFVSAILEELSQRLGVNKIQIPPYHPDANAPIESFHRVLTKGFQRFFLKPASLDIEEVLQLILFGYRTSIHTSINDTPAYLTLGIDPKLPTSTMQQRCQPANAERLAILEAIREDVIHKGHLQYLRKMNRMQKGRNLDPFKVGDVILLPATRERAAAAAITYHGRKFQPKYSLPYRIVYLKNNGRTAMCRSLLTPDRTSRSVKEVHVQDIRRLELPLTLYQREQWEEALLSYHSESTIDPDLRSKLLNDFWERVEEPPPSIDPDSRAKRSRPT